MNEAHETINSAALGLIFGNMTITVLLAVSLKTTWNLLNVMQVLTYLRFFAMWPATVDEVMVKVWDTITLKPFFEPIFNFGKTQFQIVADQT